MDTFARVHAVSNSHLRRLRAKATRRRLWCAGVDGINQRLCEIQTLLKGSSVRVPVFIPIGIQANEETGLKEGDCVNEKAQHNLVEQSGGETWEGGERTRDDEETLQEKLAVPEQVDAQDKEAEHAKETDGEDIELLRLNEGGKVKEDVADISLDNLQNLLAETGAGDAELDGIGSVGAAELLCEITNVVIKKASPRVAPSRGLKILALNVCSRYLRKMWVVSGLKTFYHVPSAWEQIVETVSHGAFDILESTIVDLSRKN